MGLILTETRRVGIADHAGDRAWWSRQEARFEVRRRQAMRHIKEWVFNLKYADEFARGNGECCRSSTRLTSSTRTVPTERSRPWTGCPREGGKRHGRGAVG